MRNIEVSIVFLFLLMPFLGFSQKINDKSADNNDTVYLFVEQMPEFPGGSIELKRYIAEHIEYPKIARDKRIQGRVFLRFEVTKTGDVGKVEILKGVHPLLDKEAIKVIKSLPKFIPGEQNGKKVSVWYSIPITFKVS